MVCKIASGQVWGSDWNECGSLSDDCTQWMTAHACTTHCDVNVGKFAANANAPCGAEPSATSSTQFPFLNLPVLVCILHNVPQLYARVAMPPFSVYCAQHTYCALFSTLIVLYSTRLLCSIQHAYCTLFSTLIVLYLAHLLCSIQYTYCGALFSTLIVLFSAHF